MQQAFQINSVPPASENTAHTEEFLESVVIVFFAYSFGINKFSLFTIYFLIKDLAALALTIVPSISKLSQSINFS